MSAILSPSRSFLRSPSASKSLDRIGATGSMLCAIHCAALPLVLVLMPALGAGLAGAGFEIGFIVFASTVALSSLILGYRRHRVLRALLFLAPGLVSLWSAVLIPPLHHNVIAHAVAMALGGTLIATSHLINLRLSHQLSNPGHANQACCSP
jgi:hypothetical protein